MSSIIEPAHHMQKAQRMSEYLRTTTTLGGTPQGTKRKSTIMVRPVLRSGPNWRWAADRRFYVEAYHVKNMAPWPSES